MAVETVVQQTSTHTHHFPLVPPKLAQKQWITQIKHTKHTPHSGLNPLVDAAAIFFTTIIELRQQSEPTPPNTLQKRLTRELNAYQQHILKHNYDDDVVLVSRYCLCAMADEIISNTAWGGNQYWDDYRLLVKLHQDASKGKRFFPILQRVKGEPEKFIDLLELIFCCLNAGFKGQYRNTLYGTSQLSMIMEQTYQKIRHVRGELTTNLSPQLRSIETSPKQAPAAKPWWRTAITTLGITAVLMIVIAGSFSYLFKVTSQQIFEHNTRHNTMSLQDGKHGTTV